MPVYTYRCEICDYHFDASQHFTDDPLTICPNCGSAGLRKVFQPVGIVFKGKGFYATDHRSPSGQTYSGNHRSETSESASGEKGATETPHKSEPISAEKSGTKETA